MNLGNQYRNWNSVLWSLNQSSTIWVIWHEALSCTKTLFALCRQIPCNGAKMIRNDVQIPHGVHGLFYYTSQRCLWERSPKLNIATTGLYMTSCIRGSNSSHKKWCAKIRPSTYWKMNRVLSYDTSLSQYSIVHSRYSPRP